MDIEGKAPLAIKTSIILLSTATLYWQDLIIVASEAVNSDISTHILVIPPLITYIIYRIRKILTTTTSNKFTTTALIRSIPIKDITGTLLCLIAYLIKWHGSYTFHPLEYHIASLPIFVAGLTLIIFNPQTLRALLFPITFLTFLTPPPVELAQKAGSALATFSSQVAYNILKTIGLPVTLSSAYMSPVIYLETSSGTSIPFAIDMACSGLYSLIGFAIFAVFLAYLARGPIQKKLAILAMGLPIIYTLNILRITLIVIIGNISGPTLALNAFHLLGGWTLILIGTLIILTLAEKGLKIQIFKSTKDTCNHSHRNDDRTHCIDCGKILKTNPDRLSLRDAIKTIFIITITISLLFIQVPVFALTEGATEVFVQGPTGTQTTKILPEIKGYDVRFVYRDTEFEEISGQNASLLFQYSPETTSKHIIWVGLEIGPTKGQLHPWEVCLITWPQTHGGEVRVKQLDLRDIHILENPPITARYFAFQRKDSNETQVVLYWYTRSLFKTGEEYQQKWTKISVIQYTYNPEEYRNIEEELLPVAKAIANYWQPITNWSWISITIAKNGPTMITTSAALLIGVLTTTLYLETKKKNNAKHIYSQISDPEDRNIIDSIKVLEKEIATETKIASKYKEITGKNINPDILYNKLIEAEESNIIKRKIININDEPYLTWKSNF